MIHAAEPHARGERKRKAAELREFGNRLREAFQRRDDCSRRLRRLYAEAKRECGLTTEALEIEIIKHRESIGRADRLDGSRVYFLRVPDAGIIKIGVTRHLHSRVATLAGAIRKPVELVGSIDGDAVAERVLHYQFRAHRQTGEFFSWAPISEQVRGLIARNSALLPGCLQ